MADASSDSCDHNKTLTQPIKSSGDDDEETDAVTHPDTPNTWLVLRLCFGTNRIFCGVNLYCSYSSVYLRSAFLQGVAAGS